MSTLQPSHDLRVQGVVTEPTILMHGIGEQDTLWVHLLVDWLGQDEIRREATDAALFHRKEGCIDTQTGAEEMIRIIRMI
jgi:hypothetical protein